MKKEDLERIQARLDKIDEATRSSKAASSARSLKKELEEFLEVCERTVLTCSPDDLRAFLVWKDDDGKTKIHEVECRNLASARIDNEPCECPVRLAHATVVNMIGRLKTIFAEEGREGHWNRVEGNPATAKCMDEYVKYVAEEQAKAHVVQKQAVPIFGEKVRRLITHVLSKRKDCKTLSKEYIYERDAALFKTMCFGGDRGGDMGYVKFQELKERPGSKDIVVSRSFGKSLRGGGEVNTFVLHASDDEVMCPVKGLAQLTDCMAKMGLEPVGYIFRKTGRRGEVVHEPFKQTAANNRLRLYLMEMGEYAGETPHSLRAGCTVSGVVGGVCESASTLMAHVGWKSEAMLQKYSRAEAMLEGVAVAENLSKIITEGAHEVEEIYNKFGDPMGMKPAF